MNSPSAVTIVPAHHQRILSDERDHLRFGYCDVSQFGERHRRVLNERYVNRLVVEELDDPLHPTHVDECFRLCPADTAAGVEHLSFETTNRRPGADFVNNLAELLRLIQTWQRALGTRSVRVIRCGYT